MKIENYQYPKSSFLTIEKDMGTIIDMILKNNRLKKLLYYTTSDCLTRPNLDEDQSLLLLEKKFIRMVPKITTDPDVMNYIIVSFDNFTTNDTNPQFRDNLIIFEILCHYDQWQMKDFQLRPYKIAAELDTMFNQRRLSGIGKIEFVNAFSLDTNDEFSGLSLIYRTVHGEEDKKNSPNELDQEDINLNFDEIFNDL